MATFQPTPFGTLAASAKDLPASLNAASSACCHRAHLISAISVADISGDNARWAGCRALALRPPAGPIALFAAAVSGRRAPPGERRWWGRQVALGAAMGRRKQSGDRNVADPGAGGGRNAHRGFIIIARMSGRLAPPGERRWWGRQVALGAAMGRRKQSGDRNVADPGAGGGRNTSPRFYYYC